MIFPSVWGSIKTIDFVTSRPEIVSFVEADNETKCHDGVKWHVRALVQTFEKLIYGEETPQRQFSVFRWQSPVFPFYLSCIPERLSICINLLKNEKSSDCVPWKREMPKHTVTRKYTQELTPQELFFCINAQFLASACQAGSFIPIPILFHGKRRNWRPIVRLIKKYETPDAKQITTDMRTNRGLYEMSDSPIRKDYRVKLPIRTPTGSHGRSYLNRRGRNTPDEPALMSESIRKNDDEIPNIKGLLKNWRCMYSIKRIWFHVNVFGTLKPSSGSVQPINSSNPQLPVLSFGFRSTSVWLQIIKADIAHLNVTCVPWLSCNTDHLGGLLCMQGEVPRTKVSAVFQGYFQESVEMRLTTWQARRQWLSWRYNPHVWLHNETELCSETQFSERKFIPTEFENDFLLWRCLIETESFVPVNEEVARAFNILRGNFQRKIMFYSVNCSDVQQKAKKTTPLRLISDGCCSTFWLQTKYRKTTQRIYMYKERSCFPSMLLYVSTQFSTRKHRIATSPNLLHNGRCSHYRAVHLHWCLVKRHETRKLTNALAPT